MSDKQAVLEAVGTLPDAATWDQITDALIRLAARRGPAADVARLYKARLRADDLAAYLHPAAEVPMESVLRDLAAGEGP